MYDPAISDKGAMLSAGRSHSRLNTNMFLPKHAVSAVLQCFLGELLSLVGFLDKENGGQGRGLCCFLISLACAVV